MLVSASWLSGHVNHPAVVVVGLQQPELDEDAVHVLLDCAFRDGQPARYARVCPTLGHQRQHLTLASGDALQWIFRSAGCKELDHERGIDDGPAPAKAIDALQELVDVRHLALQEVAASLPASIGTSRSMTSPASIFSGKAVTTPPLSRATPDISCKRVRISKACSSAGSVGSMR